MLNKIRQQLNKIHNFYLKKFKFYRTWHEQPNSKKIHKVTLALFALFALLSALYIMPFSPFRAKAASSYYVDNKAGAHCSDSGPGSASQPWCTIQKAANTVSVGDTVSVRAGTYSPFNVPPKTDLVGEADRIKFVAENGAIVSGGTNGISVNSSYITVDGFKVTGSSSHGILNNGNNNNFLNNEIYGVSGSGIYLNPRANNLVSENSIHNNGIDGVSCFDNSTLNISKNEIYQNHGDGIEFSGVNITIDGNTLYDQHTADTDHSDGIVVQAPYYRTYGPNSSGIIIRNNTVYDIIQQIYITGTAGADGSVVDGVEIYNNLLYASDLTTGVNAFGVAFDVSTDSGGYSFSSNITNVNVYNNTIKGLPYGAMSWANRGTSYGTGYSNITIKNNIITNGFMHYPNDIVSNLILDNNLYYNSTNTIIHWLGTNYTQSQFVTFQASSGQEAHGINANPLINASSRLQQGSPAINTGIQDANTPSTDKDGNPRVGAPDIGAYEYRVIHNVSNITELASALAIVNPGETININYSPITTRVTFSRSGNINSKITINCNDAVFQEGFVVSGSYIDINNPRGTGADTQIASFIEVTGSNVKLSEAYIYDTLNGSSTQPRSCIDASDAVGFTIIDSEIINPADTGTTANAVIAIGTGGVVRRVKMGWGSLPTTEIQPNIWVGVSNDNITIDDNDFYGPNYGNIIHNATSANAPMDGLFITNNRFHNCGSPAGSSEHVQFIGNYIATNNLVINGNVFSQETLPAGWDTAFTVLWAGTAAGGNNFSNVQFTHNLLTPGGHTHLVPTYWAQGKDADTWQNWTVNHNTIDTKGGGAWAPPDTLVNVSVKNNLMISGATPSQAAIDSNYNLFDSSNFSSVPAHEGNNSFRANPLIDSQYRLQAGSPAIGAGENGSDIGAFPYQGSGGGTCTIGNGDVNGDTHVNISDAAILMAKWNQNVTNDPADVNCSGKVDISDAAILMSRWGT